MSFILVTPRDTLVTLRQVNRFSACCPDVLIVLFFFPVISSSCCTDHPTDRYHCHPTTTHYAVIWVQDLKITSLNCFQAKHSWPLHCKLEDKMISVLSNWRSIDFSCNCNLQRRKCSLKKSFLESTYFMIQAIAQSQTDYRNFQSTIRSNCQVIPVFHNKRSVGQGWYTKKFACLSILPFGASLVGPFSPTNYAKTASSNALSVVKGNLTERQAFAHDPLYSSVVIVILLYGCWPILDLCQVVQGKWHSPSSPAV